MRPGIILSFIYFIVLSVEIYAAHYGDRTLVYITKPLLMPLLVILFLMNAKDNPKPEHNAFIAGLLFSLGGDVFLMLDGFTNFILGVASFLLAHVFYILSFWVRVKTVHSSIKNKWLIALPFVLYVIGFLAFLHPNMVDKEDGKALFPAIAMYGCVIGNMSYMAFLRRNAVSQRGWVLVFVGSLFFIASDSCLSTALFVGKFPYSEIAIMLTYGWAQYLLTIGTAKQ